MQSDPSVRNEFVVAGFRWGHPQIMDEVDAANTDLSFHSQEDVKDQFHDPNMMYKMGPGSCMRGSVQRFTGQLTNKFWDSVQLHLFKPKKSEKDGGLDHGSDLLSINIAVSS